MRNSGLDFGRETMAKGNRCGNLLHAGRALKYESE